MTTRSEDVLYRSLVDTDALETIVREGLDLQVVPTEAMRKVVQWAVKYFSESGFSLAPSREALMATWGDILEEAEVEIPEEDIDFDTIDWALKDLKTQYATFRFNQLLKQSAEDMYNADTPDKIDVLVQKAGEFTSLMLEVQSKKNESTGSEGIRKAIASYDIRAAREESIQGMTLGFTQLDEHLMGIRPGELCVALGKQGSGKSLLSAIAALDNWSRGKRVVLFTLENSVEMTWDRIIVAGVNRFFPGSGRGLSPALDQKVWMEGTATDDQVKRAGQFLDMMVAQDTLTVIMPEPNARTAEAMVNHAKILNADVMIIDQLTFMEATGRTNRPKTEKIGDMLHDLKALISTGNKPIPCLLMHQLKREGINGAKKSGMIDATDAADSAEVERTADQLIGLNQTQVDEQASQASLFLLKFRRGAQKHFKLIWRKGEVVGEVLREITHEELERSNG